ncbi:MAG: PilN domain-containing protein [Kiloniellaceae bacterium]
MRTMASLPAPVHQAASRFFRWWTGELVACLPVPVRERLNRTRQRLVVEISDTKATFSHGKGKALQRLGAVLLTPADRDGEPGAGQRETVERIIAGAALRTAEVVLRLPREKILRRLVELPAAAAENLREVLGFEMDRHTPFKAQEVYYDFRIKGSDAQRKRIKVDLVVIPKAVVDQVVRLAGAWGLDLDLVEVAGGTEETDQVFDLLPRSAARARSTLRQRSYVLLGALAVVLLIVAAYLPLREKEQAVAAVQADLARARADAAQVAEMKKRVEDLVTRNRFVVEQRRGQRTVTEILDEVTRLLPDHTWVLKFGLRDNKLVLSGYSAKPSALIGLLEDSEMLAGVRFSSPVTMDQKVGLERFNLTASVTGRGQS